MAQKFRITLVSVVSILLCSYGALADQIEIKDDSYAKLPPDAQQSLVAKMKDQGLLSKDDTVKYAGPAIEGQKESLGPAILLTLAPTACKVIAAAKKAEDLGKCASKKDAAAQDQCKTEVEAKFATIEVVCNAIKLF